MSWENWKIGTKLFTGFMVVVLVLAAVGFLGFRSVRSMEAEANKILEASPLIDSAVEMAVAVHSDRLLVMELFEVTDQAGVEESWKQHRSHAETYDTYCEAILNGGDTEMGYVYATKDEGLRRIVREADELHEGEFRPRIKKVHDLMREKIAAKKDEEGNLKRYEASFDKLHYLLKDLEARVDDKVDSNLKAGTTAEEILSKETVWADLTMETKASVLETRVYIEEFVKVFETHAQDEIEKSFLASIKEADSFIDLLLNGGKMGKDSVVAMNVPELRSLLFEINKAFKDEYRPAAVQIMDGHRKASQAEIEIERLGGEIDKNGERIAEILGGVKEGAKKIIDTAANASKETAAAAVIQSITGTVAGAILGILLAVFIGRSISRPIVSVAEVVRKVAAERDLTLEIPVAGRDEIGDMASELNEMLNQLQAAFKEVNDAAVGVASSARDVIKRAYANRDRAEAEVGQNQKAAAADIVTEMGGTAGEVAQASNEQRQAAEKSNEKVAELLKSMQKMAISAASQNEEANRATERVSEMSETGSKVAETAVNQGKMVMQVSAAMGEMTKAVEEMTQAVTIATEQGLQTLEAADEGNRSIAATDEGMRAIAESSEQISEIIGVITEIAEQTKLIALNAAIKVAHSGAHGAHGKGFTVFADEVGKLAQRSSEAAKEITQLIKDSTALVDEGSRLTGESRLALEKIDEVGKVNMEAIEEISKTAEIMAGSAQEVQKQTEELNTLAQQIDGMAKDQAPRRKAAEEALASLLEQSKAITSLINEANKGVQNIGDEMRTIVERTADMGKMTELQVQRSKNVMGITQESAEGARRTVEDAGTVVGIMEDLQKLYGELTTKISRFKIETDVRKAAS